MRITGILLAAGMSTRMGRPKQLLPFKNETVIETVISTLLASSLDEVLVVLGHKHELIYQKIEAVLGNKKLRIINIRRNEAALKAIGLDTNELTTIARGDKAPLNANKSSNGNKTKKKRRIPKVPTRFSTRLRNIPAVNYNGFFPQTNLRE